MEKSIQILKANGLSKTEIRKKILDLFLNSSTALSLQAIESAFDKLDRITLYRTLKTFESKGIIHRAVDGTMHPKYAICEGKCDEYDHHDNHAHFHCTICEKTVCLEGVAIPSILNLPKGYTVEETNLILSGKCEECS